MGQPSALHVHEAEVHPRVKVATVEMGLRTKSSPPPPAQALVCSAEPIWKCGIISSLARGETGTSVKQSNKSRLSCPEWGALVKPDQAAVRQDWDALAELWRWPRTEIIGVGGGVRGARRRDTGRIYAGRKRSKHLPRQWQALVRVIICHVHTC